MQFNDNIVQYKIIKSHEKLAAQMSCSTHNLAYINYLTFLFLAVERVIVFVLCFHIIESISKFGVLF